MRNVRIAVMHVRILRGAKQMGPETSDFVSKALDILAKVVKGARDGVAHGSSRRIRPWRRGASEDAGGGVPRTPVGIIRGESGRGDAREERRGGGWYNLP